jgi:hypothetical protein
VAAEDHSAALAQLARGFRMYYTLIAPTPTNPNGAND